jgi:hypothetical protein
VATNLSIESPNFEKINSEAGPNTTSAISTLWQTLNETRRDDRVHFALAQSELFLNPLVTSPTASVDNLDGRGYSAIIFSGASSVNFTGIVAPENSRFKVFFIKVVGAGTITAKHNVTSLAANRLALAGSADYSMTTSKGLIVAYANSLWQEVARSG